MATEDRQILMVSIADWESTLWTNKQHTARALRDQGYVVFYIDSMGMRQPSLTSRADLLRILARGKQLLRRPRWVEEGILVWSPPAIPIPQSGFARRVNKVVVSILLRLWLRWYKFCPAITWTYHPLTLSLLALGRWGTLVYHCVDDFSAQAPLKRSVMEVEEQRLLARADAIFVTSRALEQKFSGLANVYYYPNSVDVQHFEDAASQADEDVLAEIPHPRVGFIGAIAAYKVDATLLMETFGTHREWQLVLVGPREDRDETITSVLALPNVHHIEAVSFQEVPRYMRSFDVGIIPAVESDYTKAMFPMKFFEYLASGLPVVSTSLPALAEYSSSAKIVPRSGFGDALAATLNGNVEDPKLRSEAYVENSYAKRTARMLDQLRRLGLSV